LINLGDQTFAIDTASSNGTWWEGRAIRLVSLSDSDVLTLGDEGEVQVIFQRHQSAGSVF
jgi:pSer/pThr/pTyr-binding forkhead associated (FHA) protein